MEWAWKRGWHQVEVESDAKVIIQSIKGVYTVSSDIEVTILDILHLAKQCSTLDS
ncbi:hypothetical protein Leryth_024117, partial [Lithospermum erythrorhizon]